MAVVAIKHEEKLARSHHELSICATGFDFPTYWPCSDLHRIQGQRCETVKGKDKKPVEKCRWVSPDSDVLEKKV